MNLRHFAAYLFFLLLCLFGAAVVWSLAAPDILYHCWDSVPILCFLPPFVHDVPPLANGDYDHYIAPAWVVFSLWSALVCLALWLPWAVLRSLRSITPVPPNNALQRTEAGGTPSLHP